MKRLLLLFAIFLTCNSFAQVGINTDNSAPNSSSLLDLKSTAKGFLPPRMTTAQQNAISSPAEGLMIYNTDTKSVNVYMGSSWLQLVSAANTYWSCGQPFLDVRDFRTYSTVLIGTQCWMAQNLNVGSMVSGTVNQTNNNIIEKYCYNNSEANCNVYGGLYQWNEIMNYTTSSSSNPSGRQGICPAGWHVPSDAEWCQMEVYLDATVNCSSFNFIGTNAAGKEKETGTTHWAIPNTGATNSSGFTGLPAGWKDNSGFLELTYIAHYWSSTESSTLALSRALYFNYAQVYREYSMKTFGFSGRCIKD